MPDKTIKYLRRINNGEGGLLKFEFRAEGNVFPSSIPLAGDFKGRWFYLLYNFLGGELGNRHLCNTSVFSVFK